ncbi:DUF6804 family protein, partial [Phocaeicola vulgatus]|uniref:DUF6804 family protein n=1 Tax=Phocaeicola vulgatus TaxID=821 RepID=UPI0032BFCDE7
TNLQLNPVSIYTKFWTVSKRDGLGFLFAGLALLFQPFFKVALGRVLWNIIDLVVAVALIFLLIRTFKKKL